MSCNSLKTKQFKIITCECYYSKWKEIKDIDDESWKFDEIEEGKKSFRKLFHKKMAIAHFCESCFEKAIMMNPFILDEERAPAGYCIIRKYLNAINSCDEICNACIFFFCK